MDAVTEAFHQCFEMLLAHCYGRTASIAVNAQERDPLGTPWPIFTQLLNVLLVQENDDLQGELHATLWKGVNIL